MGNKNKTFKVLTVLATALIVTPVAVLLGNNFTNSINVTQSEDNLYTLEMNRTVNEVEDNFTGGEFNVTTTLNNEITFEADDVEKYRVDTCYIRLLVGGYINNVNPINGITSILVNYETNKGSLTLEYGDSPNVLTNTTSLPNGSTFTFDNHVSYFQIKSETRIIEIDSITITYTCQPQQ